MSGPLFDLPCHWARLNANVFKEQDIDTTPLENQLHVAMASVSIVFVLLLCINYGI